ncbi:MAG TPA: hypothetical protein VK858_19075 [Longimicrobiales bacterium]|nr:hypothetical protein [Longimicrobiales bacterium]
MRASRSSSPVPPTLRRSAGTVARAAVPAFLALILASGPESLQAQMPGPPGAGSTPFLIGARGGVEINNSDWILGAHTRFGIPGVPILDVQVVGELTFVDPPAIVSGGGFQERSLNADLLFGRGPMALGGGVVVRNSYWVDLNTPRETRTGWSGVLVLGGVPGPRSAFTGQIEYRYSRVSGIGYSAFTVGVNVAPTRLFR